MKKLFIFALPLLLISCSSKSQTNPITIEPIINNETPSKTVESEPIQKNHKETTPNTAKWNTWEKRSIEIQQDNIVLHEWAKTTKITKDGVSTDVYNKSVNLVPCDEGDIKNTYKIIGTENSLVFIQHQSIICYQWRIWLSYYTSNASDLLTYDLQEKKLSSARELIQNKLKIKISPDNTVDYDDWKIVVAGDFINQEMCWEQCVETVFTPEQISQHKIVTIDMNPNISWPKMFKWSISPSQLLN